MGGRQPCRAMFVQPKPSHYLYEKYIHLHNIYST